jgi:hypothetical protein
MAAEILSALAVWLATAGVTLAPEPLKNGDGVWDRGYWGGVSLADADGDGDQDIMLTGGYDVTAKFRPTRSLLYLNDGRGGFRRDDANALSSAVKAASGSTWGDVDADGDLDVLITTELGQKDVFYRNLGRGRFERQELGDATRVKASGFSSSWADIDGDGDLDLHAGGPALELPQTSHVFRNDAGRFVEVTGSPLENGKSNAAAVLWADFDNDGDADLLVANNDISRASKEAPAEHEAPVLYRNEGGWRFVATSAGDLGAAGVLGLTPAVGDVDGDGDLDVYLGGVRGRDRLFLNDGAAVFTEARDFSLPEHKEIAGGGAFADLDLDGDLDLIVANYGESIVVELNDGAGHFSQLADPSLDARKRPYSGLVTGDLDGDGDPDAVIGEWIDNHEGDYATLLRNKTFRRGHWLELVLVGPGGAPNPPGARVVLVSRSGAGVVRRQLREASAQTGFRSQGSNPFLFGVPSGEQIERAEIRWPDGRVQRVERPASGRRTRIVQAR